MCVLVWSLGGRELVETRISWERRGPAVWEQDRGLGTRGRQAEGGPSQLGVCPGQRKHTSAHESTLTEGSRPQLSRLGQGPRCLWGLTPTLLQAAILPGASCSVRACTCLPIPTGASGPGFGPFPAVPQQPCWGDVAE